MRHKLLQRLLSRERKLVARGSEGGEGGGDGEGGGEGGEGGGGGDAALNVVDEALIEFVCASVWRMRSSITNERYERRPLVIARWRTAAGLRPSNLVLVEPTAADKLDAGGPEALDLPEATLARIEYRLRTAAGPHSDWP